MSSTITNLGFAALVGAGGMFVVDQLKSEQREAVSVAANAAHTEQLTSQPSEKKSGFRQFQFGLSSDELRAVTEIEHVSLQEDGSEMLYIGDPLDVGGNSYEVSLEVGGHGLEVIRLRESKNESFIPICDMIRNDRVASLAERYGQPVDEPNRLALPGSVITTVHFPGTESMAVQIVSIFIVDEEVIESGDLLTLPPSLLKGSCSIDVVYKDKNEGSGGF